jgi:hypothetical protein
MEKVAQIAALLGRFYASSEPACPRFNCYTYLLTIP